MIASSNSVVWLGVACALVMMLVGAPSSALAQLEVPEVPTADVPEVPEAPELPEPELPDFEKPELPDIGKAESRVPEGYTGPTRLVLDHKKRLVLYPRFGYSQVIGTNEENSVNQLSAGVDIQIAVSRRFFVSAEIQGLYLVSGEYGLIFETALDSLSTYSAGEITFLTGAGIGMFTSLLDKQELWTHIAIKGGYLHPFYGAVWLCADVEKEFFRNDDTYWVASLSPQVGVLLPIRVDRTEIVTGLRVFAGVQASAALIFGGQR